MTPSRESPFEVTSDDSPSKGKSLKIPVQQGRPALEAARHDEHAESRDAGERILKELEAPKKG